MVKQSPRSKRSAGKAAQAPDFTREATSIVDKMLRQKKADMKNKEQLVENFDEWKAAINRLFSSRDGQYVARIMINHSGLFNQPLEINTVQDQIDKGKKQFYLQLLRPYLTKDVRNAIEP